MFYHQKVARVRVFADIQNFALRAHCMHSIPKGEGNFAPSQIRGGKCRCGKFCGNSWVECITARVHSVYC